LIGPPLAAVEAGYTVNTFATNRAFTPATVDLKLTYRTGFQWYLWNFFHEPGRLDGLQVQGGVANTSRPGSNGVIASAGRTPQGFVGTAFGGGGYFEAEIAFDPATIDQKQGFPAFWAMAVEHLAESGEQWPGAPEGYRHFFELDIFEYDRAPEEANVYGTTLHDWYGVYRKTCASYCAVSTPYGDGTVRAPPTTDWRRFHRIGVLWIPAVSATPGSIRYFFDGTEVGSPVRYHALGGEPPPVSIAAPWRFGIADRQHLVLILGSGSTPMKIRSVKVWQRSAVANFTR
jgi:hypothetical protein